MEALIINGTEDTPSVVLDVTANKFSISGRSLPEDVSAFYAPVLKWIDDFAASTNNVMNFEVGLEYFNTASSKILLDILMKLENIHGNGKQISIKWVYDASDEDMEEAGTEFKELVESLPFELQSK